MSFTLWEEGKLKGLGFIGIHPLPDPPFSNLQTKSEHLTSPYFSRVTPPLAQGNGIPIILCHPINISRPEEKATKWNWHLTKRMDSENQDDDLGVSFDPVQDESTESDSDYEDDSDIQEIEVPEKGPFEVVELSDSGSESGEDAGFSSDGSNGDSEKCPICLHKFSGQEIGVPDNCEHHFCFHCIAKWAKRITTCPIDRKSFNSIMVKRELNGEIIFIEDVTAREVLAVDWDEHELDLTFCEVCGSGDREHRLLLCDDCDLGFHLECLDPPLEEVPMFDWYCPGCQTERDARAQPQPSTSRAATSTSARQPNRVPRTSLSRRIMQERQMASSSCEKKPKRVAPTTRAKSARKTKRKIRRKYKIQSGKRVLVKSRRRRKKRSSKNPNRCRVAQQLKPTTAKGRLAQNLGLILPRPGQPMIGLPSYRPTNISPKESGRFPLRKTRYQDGIVPPLSLFGSSHDLSECFENVSDEEGGTVGVAARPQPIHRIGFPRKISIEQRIRDIEPLHISSSSNVLGPILNSQRMLHVRETWSQIPRISSGDVAVSMPLLHKEGDNDSSGYDSARGSGDYLRNTPPTLTPNIPFLTATGGSSPSTIHPATSNNSDSTTETAAASLSSNNDVSSAAADSSNLVSSVSGAYSSGHGGNSQPDDLEDFGYIHNLCSPNKDPMQKSDKANQEKRELKNTLEDDDDYNIYSDIEEEAKNDISQDEELTNTTILLPAMEDTDGDKVKDRDSDSDMVIDEGHVVGTIGSQERESRSSVESISLPLQLPNLVPQAGITTDVSASSVDEALPSLAVANSLINIDSDSQESIPLPDTTPPPSVSAINAVIDDDGIFGTVSIKKDEYDPSQPLTSSDEDDEVTPLRAQPSAPCYFEVSQSTKLKSNLASNATQQLQSKVANVIAQTLSKAITNVRKNPPTKLSNQKELEQTALSSDDENDRNGGLDLSSIPMPSDEYRRPTIQFSIPSRHRLIPISSLIKRQKGVMRKEAKLGESQSFQTEISKAFGTEKGEEEDEPNPGTPRVGNESAGINLSPEKISLVAEIFGSDNEEDDAVPPNSSTTALNAYTNLTILTSEPLLMPQLEQLQSQTISTVQHVPIVTNQPNPTDDKWKKIVESTDGVVTNLIIPAVEATKENDTSNTEDIIVVEHNSHTKDEKGNHQSKSLGERKTSGSFFESISDDEGECGNGEKKGLEKREAFEGLSTAERPTDVTSEVATIKKNRKEKDVTKEHDKKAAKRKRSESLNRSNFEEGEITESPAKRKRKSRKTKKSKYRRRSRDIGSDSFSSKDELSDKQSHERGRYSSSSDDDGRDLSWKKPSKSTRERNYRDGKPKTDEKFFREKDKKSRDDYSDRRRKAGRSQELSPGACAQKSRRRSKERDRDRLSTIDSKRGQRRSLSRSRSKTPLPWRSTSRSLSKARTRERRKSNSSSPTKSTTSRSPSGHIHSRLSSKSPRSRRRKQKQHAVSQRHVFRSRSRSRSPIQVRTRSPNKHARTRRRSRSLSSRDRKIKAHRRSMSSSSVSDASPRRKTGRKSSIDDKVPKKGKKDKEKDKVIVDKNIAREQLPPKEKEKDKKRKKKRREKSASPAKEIFADGDSIVVSLNFQKGKENASSISTSSAVKDTSGTGKHDGDHTDLRKRKGKHSRKSAETDGVPRPLKKTILIDLESSPIQEQNIGVSPTLIVLSDDEENMHESSKSNPSKSARCKDVGGDREGLAVSTTTAGSFGNSDSASPSYRHNGHGVPADSTQLQPHQIDSQSHITSLLGFSKASVSADDGTSSPTRGDSLVTSTRDSVEIPLQQDDDTLSPSSPQPVETRNKSSISPPLPQNSPPLDSMTNDLLQKDSLLKLATPVVPTLPLSLPPPPGTNLGAGNRPLGIGNIPGLFPSCGTALPSANSGGMSSMPNPIVIPTPPPPHRFNQSMLNANVLSVLNNALYAPFLAAKQMQQQAVRFPSAPTNASNRVGDRITQGAVLLPKNQISHTLSNRRGGEGGDSPFSPNSSDGDDLFEPPTEKSKSPRDKPHPMSSTSYLGSNHDKADRSGTAPGKGKTIKLFDTIFGGPASAKKPNPVQAQHPKPGLHSDKSVKPRVQHHKPRPNNNKKPPPKKDIVKLSESELRQTEDVPTSAVDLRVKEKFLKKLNRQERVVEEVKLSLKPHYSQKHVNKDEYKEILRRAVPKICHNKSGEINPFKIKELVEAYVKKFRKNRKS